MPESALRQLVPQSAEPFVRSYNPFNPAFRETMRASISDLLGGRAMGGTPTQRYRANIADMLTGAVEMAPGVGEAVGVTDTRQAIRSGDYGTAAMLGGATALGMVPVIGDAASRAIREGLDMSQAARMQRAADQNFNETVLYHATTKDFPAFQKNKMGTSASIGTKEKAVWMSSDPEVAGTYLPGQFVNRANAPHTEDIGGGVGRHYSEGSNIMPLRVSLDPDKISWWDMGGARYNHEDVEEILANARREGMQAVVFNNIRDEGVMGLGRGKRANTVAVFDPANIRSVNAAFDPAPCHA